MMELASPSDSAGSSGSLPTQLMLNLVQLTLVSLQHCTKAASPSGALESSNDDVTSSTASVVNKHLFDAIVRLLIAVPKVITDVLPLLLKIVSGEKFSTYFAISLAGRSPSTSVKHFYYSQCYFANLYKKVQQFITPFPHPHQLSPGCSC